MHTSKSYLYPVMIAGLEEQRGPSMLLLLYASRVTSGFFYYGKQKGCDVQMAGRLSVGI